MSTINPSYGSDSTGMVWGYRFRSGEPPEPIEADSAASMLSTAAEPSAGWFLWLHFSLANAASERWIQQNLNVPASFLGALHEEGGSTRIEQDQDFLVGTIHDVLFEFGFDAADVSTVHLCVEPRVLISARVKPLRSLDRVRSSVRSGATFVSTADLLGQLLRDQANVLVEIVRGVTAKVDSIEDAVLRQRIAASRAQLGALRRVLVRLQRLLAPEPAALFRLLSRPPSWVGEEDVRSLQQSAEEFSAAVTDSATLVERVKLIQEELASLINEQNNRILFVLTLVTVLALPVNLIAGLFGMNVGGIPFADAAHGFAVVITIVVSLTAILAFLWFRSRR